MSDHMDPLSIDCELSPDLLSQGAQIPGVINTAVGKVATGIGGVPKVVTVKINRAVRVAVQKSSGLRQRTEPHVGFLVGAGGAVVAVQQNHEGHWRLAV